MINRSGEDDLMIRKITNLKEKPSKMLKNRKMISTTMSRLVSRSSKLISISNMKNSSRKAQKHISKRYFNFNSD